MSDPRLLGEKAYRNMMKEAMSLLTGIKTLAVSHPRRLKKRLIRFKKISLVIIDHQRATGKTDSVKKGMLTIKSIDRVLDSLLYLYGDDDG